MKKSSFNSILATISLLCSAGAFVISPIAIQTGRKDTLTNGRFQEELRSPTFLLLSSTSEADRQTNSQSRDPREPRRYNGSNRINNKNGQQGGGPQSGQPPRRSYNSNNFVSRGGPGIGGGEDGGGAGAGAPVLTLVNPMKISKVVDQVAQTDSEREQSAQEMAERPQRPPRQDRPPRGDGQDRYSRQDGQDRPPRQGYNRQDGPRQQGAPPRRLGPKTGGDDKSDGGDDSEYGAASPLNYREGGAAPTKDFARKRDPKAQQKGRRDAGSDDKHRGTKKRDDDSDSRNKRKTSLRVGAGTKGGRGAELNRRRGSLRKRDRSAEKEARAEAALERNTVSLPEGLISVSELAEIIDEKPVAIIKFLMTDLGVMASMTQNLDPATCIAVVEGFGKVLDDDDYDDDEMMEILAEESALTTGFVDNDDDPITLKPRAPVVTIMGHVDHGKTSLLDAIRNTDVTAGEAGGITQAIAAYQVNHNGNMITFIDTPGHAAFTDMRERGANITDIVILVVAADDGVKQQTVDSVNCARQAGVPIIVAINKCDLETADAVKVLTELTAYDILTEDLGGEVLSAQISAKTGSNLDDLLDKVMMQAEIQDLKANPDRDAEGFIVEAYVERGFGTVATTLIKKGTLRVGDIFVAGETYGKVRALISTTDGKTRLQEATPSTPVRIVGFEGIPSAGDVLTVAKTEQLAREIAENRQRLKRERESSTYQAGLMGSVQRAFGASKDRREMCVLVKADVQGSAEALTRALRELKLENDEATVTVKVLVSEAGEVSKSDISIASVTPGTTVLAFNVPASYAAMEDARMQGIKIEYYDIVYDAIESVESRMQEVLSPTPEGEYSGSALVQEVFNIGGTGNIAGSRCQDGIIKKGSNVRVMRGDKILIETKVKTLRNFKAETDKIEEGNECGIGLVDFEDFQAGDIIECYIV